MNNCDLAENPNTPPETLDRLANDNNATVRWRVAANPNTSSETLDRLSYDEEWCVRECVARNPNTTQESLKNLANDNNRVVAYYATSNENFNNPLKLDTYEFFNWLEQATITDLEEFGNKKYENNYSRI